MEDIDKQFVAANKVQDYYLTTKIDAFQKDVNGDIKISLIALFIIAIFTLGFVYWYSNNMGRRIQHLRDIITEISHLDLSKPDVYPTRNDELGDNALAIIDMKRNLKEVISNLTSSSITLAASSEQLSAMANEQSKAVEVVSLSVQQISEGASQNVISISEVSAIVEEISSSTEEISTNATTINSNT